MKPIQDLFNRLQEKRRTQSQIRKQYKDALMASSEYQKILDEANKLRAKKRAYELSVKEQSEAQFKRLDDLALTIRQDTQMLSDVALTAIMKGDRIEVRDDRAEYEPVFAVRFRKLS
jgi:hypothetical protein